jgi:hypothetical protein
MLEKNQDMIGRMYDERVNALKRLAKIRTLAMAEGILNMLFNFQFQGRESV